MHPQHDFKGTFRVKLMWMELKKYKLLNCGKLLPFPTIQNSLFRTRCDGGTIYQQDEYSWALLSHYSFRPAGGLNSGHNTPLTP